MPLVVNLRHLVVHDLALAGDLPPGDLDIDPHDEVIRVMKPLHYEMIVQKLDEGFLLRGELRLPLNCQCVRCLKPFEYSLIISDWTCHVPLDGEEAAAVVSDCVDLTPYLREDILLEFPRHPLCEPECRGLKQSSAGKSKKGAASRAGKDSSAWIELDKLKL